MIRQFVTKFRRKNCDSKEIPIKKRNPSNRELKARLGKRALGVHEKRGEFAGDVSISTCDAIRDIIQGFMA